MTFQTLSNIYQAARKIERILGTPNGTDGQVQQKLRVLADATAGSAQTRLELSMALDSLASNCRVLALDEVVIQAERT